MPRRYLPFIVILLFAFAVRMWDIDARSLWFDESIEYWIATSSVTELLINAWEGLNDPPLYVFLLHWWMKIGQGGLFLRFPSVCFSLLTVATISVLTKKLFGRKASLIAAAVATILPSEIRYAQEVGEYALMVFAITLSLLSWLRVTQEHSWTSYALWVVGALCATYSYYYAIFPIWISFAVIIVNAYLYTGKRGIVKSLVSLSLYGVAVSPLVWLFLFKPRYDFSSILTSVAQTDPSIELSNLFVGTTKNLIGFQLMGWPWTGVPESGLILLIMTLVFLIMASLSSYPRLWLMLFVLTWLVYFITGRARTFGFRYGLILTPLLVPTLAQAISFVLGRKYLRLIGAVALTGLTVMCGISLPNRTFRQWVYPYTEWPWPETQDMREIVDYWVRYRRMDDPTYVYYGAVPAFRYYLQQRGLETTRLPALWYSHCWSQSAPDYCRMDNIFYGAWIRNRSPEMKLDSIWKTLGIQPSRLWLVFSHVYPGEQESILHGLSKAYQVSLAYGRSGAVVYLLERR